MSAPPFHLLVTPEFSRVLDRIARDDQVKHRKILKAIRLLRDYGPSYPGLNAHKYVSLSGPNGEDLWEVYVENKTPSAWRLWWCYGPQADVITLVSVGPHP